MKIIKMRLLLVITILVMSALAKVAVAQQKFEKAEFYSVMSTGDVAAIDNQLDIVLASASPNKQGYEGALLMKKAGMVSGPKKKLDLFKAGRIKMETAILNDADNTEYHFLRLAIEEHAPKIVKYHNDIENDKAIIKKKFRDLSPVVQHAILDYCKNSKILHEEDFSSR